jgi:ferrochelatase
VEKLASERKRIAVVLFNLGGPDSPESIRPFLQNLFSDPAILQMPNPFRYLMATYLARRREPEAIDIYEKMGGKSPILEFTKAQAQNLQAELTKQYQRQADFRVFVSMRYWHPMSDEVAKAVKDYGPDEIFLVPLYPQFSCTTTESSFNDWAQSAKRHGLFLPTKKTCCYPTQEDFITAHASLVLMFYEKALEIAPPRILFTAHGLPKNVLERGDPYQWQVEQTAEEIVERLGISGLDWRVCYQSRVGPLEWLQPYTEDLITKAAKERTPIVLVPISFVSEHSETLVELDIQYRQLAINAGLPPEHYFRVPALDKSPFFIQALATICGRMMKRQTYMDSGLDRRICPEQLTGCLYSKIKPGGIQ